MTAHGDRPVDRDPPTWSPMVDFAFGSNPRYAVRATVACGIFSPPSARAARGGEGSGAGGASAYSLAEGFAERPPTPDPSPPLRGGRGDSASAMVKPTADRNQARILSRQLALMIGS
jgi:hypothetical protein